MRLFSTSALASKAKLPNTPYQCCTLLVTFVCLFGSTAAISANPEFELSQAHDLNTSYISWMPGERYDPKLGTMNYSKTDLSVPGNGKLPIEIKRSFFQIPAERGSQLPWIYNAFGVMHLSTPKVMLPVNSRQPYLACNGQPGNGFWQYEPSMRFTDGDQAITFFPVTPENKYLATSSGVTELDFISVDNWGIKCLPDDPNVNYMGRTLLDVYSPDGVVYRMRGRKPRRNVEEPNAVVYLVDKITDAYGNWLDYEYQILEFPPRGKGQLIIELASIEANDGRKVDIEWETLWFLATYYSRITSIRSSGTPNPQLLEYVYYSRSDAVYHDFRVIKNGIQQGRYQFRNGTIGSITYPTGAEFVYTYNPSIKYDGLHNFAQVATRTSVEDGKSFIFDHHHIDDSTYSRLIRTPSAVIEHRYRYPPALIFNAPEAYNVESGNRIRHRVFDPDVNWSADTTDSLLLDRTFSYKSIYNINTAIGLQEADRIVLDKVVTSMNSGQSVFTTEYAGYDSLGFPESILETNAQSESRITTFIYQHDGFDTWIRGKPRQVRIDGKDVTQTSYNSKGDVETVVKNDKKIAEYGWHRTGYDKGEMSYAINGQGGKTEFSKYYRGQAREIKDPKGHITYLSVNADGTLQSKRRPGDPNPTVFQYDKLQRLAEVDPARQATRKTTYSWSADNRRRKELDRGELVLDKFGRTIIDARLVNYDDEWSTVEYAYNAEGKLIFESHPQSRKPDDAINDLRRIGRQYEYDGLGRLKKAIESTIGTETITTNYNYAASNNGNLTIVKTDGNGNKTTTEYESYGMPDYNFPVSIEEADGTISSIERNSIGIVENHIRGSATSHYQYNSQNLVRQMERPEDGLTLFEYYDDGSLKRRSSNDRVASYYYYPDLKLKQEDHIDNVTGNWVKRFFTFNKNGQLATTTIESNDSTQNNTISYLYDEDDNLLSETLKIDSTTLDINYGYDNWSNRASIKFPNGNHYSLSPNAAGNPTHIATMHNTGPQTREYTPSNSVTPKTIFDSIKYHAGQSPKLLKRNGHQVSMTIDSGQRPKEYKLNQNGPGNINLLGSKTYFYNKSNNVRQINDVANNRETRFRYDNRNRLTAAAINNADNWEFAYTDTDNFDWIQHGDVYSKYHYEENTKRLRKVDTNGTARRFEYDTHGNITSHERLKDSGAVTRMNLTFNAANQVVAMSDGTKFAYDARGLRVKKDLGGPIYTFYDSDKKLIYRDDIGTGVTSEYFYVNSKLVARRDIDLSESADTNTIPSIPATALRPGVPSTRWPTNGGVEPNPQYKWLPAPRATSYEIVTRDANSDEQWVYEKISASDAGCAEGASSCRLNKPDSSLSGDNRWQVRSQNSFGFSEWSEWRYFSVKN